MIKFLIFCNNTFANLLIGYDIGNIIASMTTDKCQGDQIKWHWTKWYGQNGSNFFRL